MASIRIPIVKPRRRLLLATLATVLALAACGGEDGNGGAGSNADQAFLEAMIPHHKSAVEMAEVARRRSERPEIQRLAEDIVSAQSKEIRQMEQIHQRLFDAPIEPDPGAHQGLGLSAEEAGMAHMESSDALERARPFDKAFIDEMIGHHQGAIRMAKAVLERTEDDEVRSLATAIADAQTREIEQMNVWRTRWYGAPSPAGDAASDMNMPAEEHEGH